MSLLSVSTWVACVVRNLIKSFSKNYWLWFYLMRVYLKHIIEFSKAAVCRLSIKCVFLKFTQNLQDNSCVAVFFNKVAGLQAYTFIKKRLQHRCFPASFAKFQRTSGQLLLNFEMSAFHTIVFLLGSIADKNEILNFNAL